MNVDDFRVNCVYIHYCDFRACMAGVCLLYITRRQLNNSPKATSISLQSKSDSTSPAEDNNCSRLPQFSIIYMAFVREMISSCDTFDDVIWTDESTVQLSRDAKYIRIQMDKERELKPAPKML